MIYAFIVDRCADLPVAACCRTMKVPRSAFFAWRHAQLNPTARMLADRELGDLVVKIHDQSFGTYGTRRVTAELRLGLGRDVNHQRVERLMRGPSAASGNVCALDEFAEGSVVCVAVPPDDVAADHAGLLAMGGVVGAVEGEVAQRLELGFDPVQPRRVGRRVGEFDVVRRGPLTDALVGLRRQVR
jgi:hypothetical protein